MMRTRVPMVLLLLAAAWGGGPPAEAGKQPRPAKATDEAADKKARAQKLVGEGRALFDKDAYFEAIDKFEEAYRLFPVPKMLYNLGITYEAIHRNDRAVCSLERFLADVPDADPGPRKDSEERLARLRPTVGRIQVDAPAGAVVSLDGEERDAAPLKAPLCAAEGKHRVVASVSGATPVGLDVNVRAGAALHVALDPSTSSAKLLSDSIAAAAAVAARSTPTPAGAGATGAAGGGGAGGDDQPVWKRGWFWGVVGVVVAGAVVGVVIGTRPTDATPPAANYGPVMVFK